jgi:hypothetical protein
MFSNHWKNCAEKFQTLEKKNAPRAAKNHPRACRRLMRRLGVKTSRPERDRFPIFGNVVRTKV